jgi:divalent metal cation (Fe/Co/Zn/Cd) transporter
LTAAHAIAERVEAAIRERPGVSDVQTHLEPLERPLQEAPGNIDSDTAATSEIQELVSRRTGSAARRVRLLTTGGGRVVFITLAGREGESLTEAHTLAGELEDELRHRIADLADVVIHTEP